MRAVATGALGDHLHRVGGNVTGLLAGCGAAPIGLAPRQREGLLDLLRRPQRLRVELDEPCRHGNAPALDLLGGGIIDGARDTIRLHRVSGVVVAVDGVADALAELLCEIGIDGLAQEEPILIIAGTGLDRQARARGRAPAHALVRVAVDDQREDGGGVGELAALVAA